jgi:hypothetical protein
MFRTSLVASAFAAFTALAVAAPAYAGEKDQGAQHARRPKRHEGTKNFVERINARVARMVDAATKRIEADRSLTAARKRAMIAQVNASAQAVKVAAAAAKKNGHVTKEEAKAVRAIMKAEVKKIREMIPGAKMERGKKHRHGRRGGTSS